MNKIGRLIAGLLAIFLFALQMPGKVSSQSSETVSLGFAPETITTSMCEAPVEVAVRVVNVENLSAYSLKVNFPADKMEILKVTNGGFLDEGIYEPSNEWDNTAGTISFGMTEQRSTENPEVGKSGDGDLILIRLMPLVDDETITLEIDSENSWLVSWPDVMPIAFSVSAGEITVNPCDSSALELSGNRVAENLPAGTEVGVFTTQGPSSYLYTLLSGSPTFMIDGSRLLTAAPLNYEENSEYTIEVQSKDSNDTVVVTRTFTILVEDVNDPPVLEITDPSFEIDEEVLFTKTFTATDEDQNPVDILTFSLKDQQNTGAQISADGEFRWTPSEAQGPGSYDFEICVSDGHVEVCQPITIVVNDVNQAPKAFADQYAMAENAVLSVAAMDGVLKNDVDDDGDPLTAVLVQAPANGSVTLAEDGSFTYQPKKNFSGTDTFTYYAYDGQLKSNITTVTITIEDQTRILYLPVVSNIGN